jgi:hypothetical protein
LILAVLAVFSDASQLALTIFVAPSLQLLKKRCRELGISRWPYDKIRSIKVIIDTLKGLENGQGQAPTPQVSAIERLMALI